MGFGWGSQLQWPTEGQVFKLEGVIYYVNSKAVGSMPVGFLGVKERS